MTRKRTDGVRRAQARYNKETTRQVLLRLNLRTDADILAFLDGLDNKQGYIKALIRRDMALQAPADETPANEEGAQE